MGNNDDCADALLAMLFHLFADACDALQDNGGGGIVRAGSGSAMYYVWLARGLEGMMTRRQAPSGTPPESGGTGLGLERLFL